MCHFRDNIFFISSPAPPGSSLPHSASFGIEGGMDGDEREWVQHPLVPSNVPNLNNLTGLQRFQTLVLLNLLNAIAFTFVVVRAYSGRLNVSAVAECSMVTKRGIC